MSNPKKMMFSFTSRGRGRGVGRGRGGYRGKDEHRHTPTPRDGVDRAKWSEEKRMQRKEEKKRLIDEKFSPPRGEEFKGFIHGLLTKSAKIPEEKSQMYLKHIQMFEQAFTHSSFDEKCNYEAMELLGDATLNFCVVQYLTQRFPELMADDGSGVGVLARLKINLVSKSIFSKCADSLGFSPYIASNLLMRKEEMPSLLEDTFEAFQGALIRVATTCDPGSKRKGFLTSLGPAFRMISGFFDGMEISIKYDDLYDAITRLKQLLESIHANPARTEFTQALNDEGKIVFTYTVRIHGLQGAPVDNIWGTGQGFLKNEAEQNACDHAIAALKKAGYEHQPRAKK